MNEQIAIYNVFTLHLSALSTGATASLRHHESGHELATLRVAGLHVA